MLTFLALRAGKAYYGPNFLILFDYTKYFQLP